MTALGAPPAGASSSGKGTADGGEWFAVEDGWTWCETANVAFIAKDCQPSPGLKPSDPHMDVILSRGHTRVQLGGSFLRSEHGMHVHDPWFHILKVAEIVFTPRNPAHECVVCVRTCACVLRRVRARVCACVCVSPPAPPPPRPSSAFSSSLPLVF
jgi:hypothetical protein